MVKPGLELFISGFGYFKILVCSQVLLNRSHRVSNRFSVLQSDTDYPVFLKKIPFPPRLLVNRVDNTALQEGFELFVSGSGWVIFEQSDICVPL